MGNITFRPSKAVKQDGVSIRDLFGFLEDLWFMESDSMTSKRVVIERGPDQVIVEGRNIRHDERTDKSSGQIDKITPYADGKPYQVIETDFSLAQYDRAGKAEDAGKEGAMADFLFGLDFDFRATVREDIRTRDFDGMDGFRGDDVFRLTGANDRFNAGSGDDRLYGGGGDDVLWGNRGDDRVVGGSGDDRVIGNSGDDRLEGDGGDDLINAGTGDDVLIGGAGVDRLMGGKGVDTFVFRSVSDSTKKAPDTIVGFKAKGSIARDDAFEGAGIRGGDVIDLSGIDANEKRSGNQEFRLADQAPRKAGNLWLVNLKNGDTEIRGENDGARGYDFRLVIRDEKQTTAEDYAGHDFLL